MADPYVGEIRIFAGNFAPRGWMFCDGALQAISANIPLYQLLGTTYGGDGEETFALPDLRGRLPIHQGNGFVIGESGGVEEVTLTTTQIPAHSHPLLATGSIGTLASPQANVLGKVTNIDMFSGDSTDTPLSAVAIQPAGGSQPHTNLQPFLCVNFIISLNGVYPSQT